MSSRAKRYAAKLDAEVIGSRYDALKEGMIKKHTAATDKLVDIENQVKALCVGESVILLPYYMIYAKELSKREAIAEREITYYKWAARGVDFFKLFKIAKEMFGVRPELRNVCRIDNIVLNLPFYEGAGTVAHDVSGFGNDGTSPSLKWEKGNIGNAIMILPGDQPVAIAANTSLEISNQITLMCWILMPMTAPLTAGIIVKNPLSPAVDYALIVIDDGSGNMMPAFYFNDNLGNSHATVALQDLRDEKWHHIAATYDQSTLRLYIDGEEVSSSFDPGLTIQTSSSPLWLGKWYSFVVEGLLDELTIWNRALSASEILEIYNITK